MDIDSRIELDGAKSGSGGTKLDLNKNLDLNRSVSTTRLDAFWRVTPKHKIDFSWYEINQNGSASLTNTINILGFSIPVGASLQSEIDMETFKFNYTYNFFQAENYEFGPSIGVHLLDINTRFQPSTFVGPVSRGTTLSDGITLPAPVIGLRGAYAFTDNLLIRGSFDYTNLEIDTWDAELYDVLVALEYNIFEHFGVGVGYNYINIDVKNNTDQDQLKINQEFNGALVFIKGAF